MNKIPFILLLLCLIISCSKDSDATDDALTYKYYYPTDEATITASEIASGNGAFDPKGIAIANNKLYICNGDVLEIFDATTLKYLKTISNYTKGSTTIALTKLSSVSIDNGRIYVGSVDSRLFIFDENTNTGISTVGNGQWWNTFVHVFGVAVKDGFIFVKEKETSIKVFETSQITETSDWNLKPLAKLNTLSGFDQIYSMDVESGNLVVAGREAKSYLYYNIANIKTNAANSLIEPIKPTTELFADAKPNSVSFNADWAITTETVGSANYLRLYPKKEFMNKQYIPQINTNDIMGENSFGSIVSTVIMNDRIFLSDNTNKKIRIIKLNQSTITEQN